MEGSTPDGPVANMPLFILLISRYIMIDNTLTTASKIYTIPNDEYNDPLQNFLYALKAPDSKRQYPRRLEYFFDYLGLMETLKERNVLFFTIKQKPIFYGLNIN